MAWIIDAGSAEDESATTPFSTNPRGRSGLFSARSTTFHCISCTVSFFSCFEDGDDGERDDDDDGEGVTTKAVDVEVGDTDDEKERDGDEEEERDKEVHDNDESEQKKVMLSNSRPFAEYHWSASN